MALLITLALAAAFTARTPLTVQASRVINGRLTVDGGPIETDLQAAIDSLDGAHHTIKLFTGLTVAGELVIKDKDITFDLNGNELRISNPSGNGLSLQDSNVDCTGRGAVFISAAGIPRDFQSGWAPLRLLCEMLGYSVVWDDVDRNVYINSPGVPLTYISTPDISSTNIYIDNKLTSVVKVNLQGRYYAEINNLMHALVIICIQHSDYYRVCDMFIAEPLSEDEKTVPPPHRDIFGEGLYRVGVDIPAGWYELETQYSEVVAVTWYDEEDDTDYHSIIGTHFYNQRSFVFYSSVSPDKVPEADWKRF